MRQPTAAMVVIGDEILSGRTRDSNAHHLANVLTEIGVALREVRMIADDPDEIMSAVRAMSQRYDYVFTSGGIGPTHDDITADAVASAFGTNIDVRPDAREILERHYRGTGRELNAARLRMARIPEGATLIDNPVSGAPGFQIENVRVMAGVPAVFEAMLESVRSGLTGGPRMLSHSFRCEIGEGDLAGPLGEIASKFPDVSMGSYPFGGGAGAVLVLRATEREILAQAASALRSALVPLGGAASEKPPSPE